MMQAPLPPNENERLEALRAYAILDTLPEQAYDDLTFLASQLCGTPIALVSLVDSERQWFKSKVGLDASETSREVAFCSHAILRPDDLLLVPDAQQDERFADNPLVQVDPSIRFYAGAPLVTSEGMALGTMCVIDRVPRDLSPDQAESLRALSRQVMAQLELRLGMKRMEKRTRELEEIKRELEQSNKELDDFAYIASHDLKEPLRGIHNYSKFLIEDYADKLDDEAQRKLHTLTRLTTRLETLIGSLLHFSRLGRVDLAIEETDLDAVVDEVIDSMHIRLQEEHVELRRPAALPSIRCDRSRIGEVFRNLVSNAMKYNDKPEPWIEIGWEDETPDPVFYVRDNGIGIKEKHQERVFQMFKRLHGREAYGGGTGAGLCIVSKLVEKHGGRIWLDSTPSEGTTFRFTLPGRDR